MAVYNHYQRLMHADSLAASRTDREEAAGPGPEDLKSGGRGYEADGSPSAHAQPVPYPPSEEALRILAESRAPPGRRLANEYDR